MMEKSNRVEEKGHRILSMCALFSAVLVTVGKKNIRSTTLSRDSKMLL